MLEGLFARAADLATKAAWSAARLAARAAQASLVQAAPATLAACWGVAGAALALSWPLEWQLGFSLRAVRVAAAVGALSFTALVGPATAGAYVLLGRLARADGAAGAVARRVLRAHERRRAAAAAAVPAREAR